MPASGQGARVRDGQRQADRRVRYRRRYRRPLLRRGEEAVAGQRRRRIIAIACISPFRIEAARRRRFACTRRA